MQDIPRKYDPKEAEPRWQRQWEEWGIHRYDPSRARDETFVVDTPPPTVSGSLHVGHVFSYTHQDLLVRYQRMLGKNIHYGMGWDDNGLPTERRVQNHLGIRCNPKLPHDATWKPGPRRGPDDEVEEVCRRDFIEACGLVTREDERVFEHLWRRLGLSVDWNEGYATIDGHCRRVAQFSFLDLVAKGQVYQVESPTMWDVDFKTAVAQAEVEDREKPGVMHDLRFGIASGGAGHPVDGELTIATTRPELLAACIAVVAHPDDARYQPHFGKVAVTPLFGAEVPILPAAHADPGKGTGILMVCTFGDAMDVEWWRRSGLALKQVIGLDGRMLPIRFGEAPFHTRNATAAQTRWDALAGLSAAQAKKKAAELCAQEGSGPGGRGIALAGEPRTLSHPVKFYEKGDRPLEFIPTRQWFVKILEHKEALLAQGAKIQWHPESMKTRYDHWVMGLNQDWCISRQRYFGVPFPVWYPVLTDGRPDYDRPVFAAVDALPVDPLSDCPPGLTPAHRDVPGGFTGDPDVMDTWATSSLTPQVQSRWVLDPQRHARLFPMDIRPQSHEIIRTWAFYTIVKAWMHEREIPWRHVVISGWILDPDRKKMSKSKGNTVTPEGLLDEHSVDAVRYWAGRARLGTDTAFDESVFAIGKRIATKVFNASRFVFAQLDRVAGDHVADPAGDAGPAAAGSRSLSSVSEPIDRAFLRRLRAVVEQAGAAFDRFEFAVALQGTEGAFWTFCDDYLELAKSRSYADDDSPGRRSAVATLHFSISVFLRLLAPFLPYVTEEVWSWRLAGTELRFAAMAPAARLEPHRTRSIHTAPWPTVAEFAELPGADDAFFTAASDVLGKIRGAKSEAKKSLRWPVTRLAIRASREDLGALDVVLADVLHAGAAEGATVERTEGAAGAERFQVQVTLAETAGA